jgi:hypothetical protein
MAQTASLIRPSVEIAGGTIHLPASVPPFVLSGRSPKRQPGGGGADGDGHSPRLALTHLASDLRRHFLLDRIGNRKCIGNAREEPAARPRCIPPNGPASVMGSRVQGGRSGDSRLLRQRDHQRRLAARNVNGAQRLLGTPHKDSVGGVAIEGHPVVARAIGLYALCGIKRSGGANGIRTSTVTGASGVSTTAITAS